MMFFLVGSFLANGHFMGEYSPKIAGCKKKMSMILNLQSPQSRNYVENVP